MPTPGQMAQELAESGAHDAEGEGGWDHGGCRVEGMSNSSGRGVSATRSGSGAPPSKTLGGADAREPRADAPRARRAGGSRRPPVRPDRRARARTLWICNGSLAHDPVAFGAFEPDDGVSHRAHHESHDRPGRRLPGVR